MKLRRDVRDWVVKAEQDVAAASTLLRKRKPALNDVVCFHAQQCAEKYLKALLTKYRLAFPKTHDLLDLMGLAKRREPTLELIRPMLEYLQPYAIDFRYPGESATRREAQQATRFVLRVRETIRRLLHETISRHRRKANVRDG